MEEDSHKAEDMFYPGVTEFTMDEAVTTCQYLGKFVLSVYILLVSACTIDIFHCQNHMASWHNN